MQRLPPCVCVCIWRSAPRHAFPCLYIVACHLCLGLASVVARKIDRSSNRGDFKPSANSISVCGLTCLNATCSLSLSCSTNPHARVLWRRSLVSSTGVNGCWCGASLKPIANKRACLEGAVAAPEPKRKDTYGAVSRCGLYGVLRIAVYIAVCDVSRCVAFRIFAAHPPLFRCVSLLPPLGK
jgi:hypothetical protein